MCKFIGRFHLLALVGALAAPAHAASDLTILSLEQLLDVSIVGASKYEQKQSEVAAAVSVITRQEIKAFGWRTLAEALASLPGVHTTYDRQYSYVGMRGFGLPGDYNTRMLVTINGNRLNDINFDQAYIGREFPLDLDLIERIEFIPGPGGAVYGHNAMFGVVNVVTRTGADFEGGELALAGQHPQASREGRASWGKVLDNDVDVLLSASGMRSRGEDRFFEFGSSGVSGMAVDMDGERDQEFFVRLSRGPWSLDVVHGNHRKDDPTGAYRSDPLVKGQYQADRNDLVQLQYQDSFAGDTLHVTGRLFAGTEHYEGILSYGSQYFLPAASEWRGGEVRLLSTAWDGHKVMVGLEAQDNVRQSLSVIDFANPANNLYMLGSGYRTGLYVQDEWRINDSLAATVGLRWDRSNISDATTSPRAALIWKATPETTFKALYGRAHRAPNMFERDYGDGVSQVANPSLDGERVDTVELIADHRVDRDLVLRGSLYRWTMRKLITLGLDPVSGLGQYQSGETVNAHGLELSADKTWAAGARLRASVSIQDVAYASGGALLNSPKLLSKFNFSSPLPLAGLRMGYEWQYNSERLSLDGSKLGGYALSNLYLSTESLVPRTELSLGFYNLFDKRYAHPGADINWQNALVQDGRSVRAKLLYRF